MNQLNNSKRPPILLPHRKPMLWVEKILSSDGLKGTCWLKIEKGAHYMGPSELRQSAMIEWMAQSYGLVSSKQKVKRAMVVSFEDFSFSINIPQIGDEIFIKVALQRILGPQHFVEGLVLSKDGHIFCQGKLRLFAEMS